MSNTELLSGIMGKLHEEIRNGLTHGEALANANGSEPKDVIARCSNIGYVRGLSRAVDILIEQMRKEAA